MVPRKALAAAAGVGAAAGAGSAGPVARRRLPWQSQRLPRGLSGGSTSCFRIRPPTRAVERGEVDIVLLGEFAYQRCHVASF